MPKTSNNKKLCKCDVCKNKLPFEMPQEIIDASINGDLVVFAGAGISTESRNIFKETFYENIFYSLNLNPNEQIDFPNLMSKFCKQKNGRRILLERIRERIEYCHQFKELYRASTFFHQELSSIHQIQNIITTNWDDFFERECNAIPIVTANDFAFYNTSGRKVYKIHGSISNYGSIVATQEDYQKCYKELKSGIIGSTLKMILATKTVLFVGFSFRDFDFNKIYDYLKNELKEVIPHCYIVTIDETYKEKFNKDKVTVINTDGTYFFSMLRKHLEGEGHLIDKSNLDTVDLFSFLRSNFHDQSAESFAKNKTSIRLYNLLYQDGLQHAFDYLIYHSKSGLSFNPNHIFNLVDSYSNTRSFLSKKRNYPDLAYTDGYIAGLHSILMNDENPEKNFPFWYIIGFGPVTSLEQYEDMAKDNSINHKSAEAHIKKYMPGILDPATDIIPHHRAFIF